MHDARRLGGEHRGDGVEQHSTPRLRAIRARKPPAGKRSGRRDDHRRTRTEKNQGREVDDEGRRHGAAVCRARPLDGQDRNENRRGHEAGELPVATRFQTAARSQQDASRDRDGCEGNGA